VARLLIVVAGGMGSRLGHAEPKALVPLAGRPLVARTLEAFLPLSFARVVVCAPADRLSAMSALLGSGVSVVAGGETRSGSVRRGFDAAAPGDADVVAVHDAARPFLSAEEILGVLREAELVGAAIAATPVVDTIKRSEAGRIVETVDRRDLWAAATPQAFRGAVLRRALASGEDATDEAALCERLGIPVAIVPVSRLAFKITTPEDLALAEAIVARRKK